MKKYQKYKGHNVNKTLTFFNTAERMVMLKEFIVDPVYDRTSDMVASYIQVVNINRRYRKVLLNPKGYHDDS